MSHALRLSMLMALPLTVLGAGCSYVGCAGEDPLQDLPAAEQFNGAIEQPLPAVSPKTPLLYGTWDGDMTAGHLKMLVLMTNAKFHSEQTVICVKEPCNPIVREGSYKLYTRDARTFLELQSTQEDGFDRYEYSIDQKVMRLRPLMAGAEWYSMQRSGVAWCDEARHCTVQGLPPGICAGAYACEKNACMWKCAAAGQEEKPDDTADPARSGGPVANTATCPQAMDCSIASAACAKNQRDRKACETEKSCQTCFPYGWDVKNVPRTQEPNTNPVLKQ